MNANTPEIPTTSQSDYAVDKTVDLEQLQTAATSSLYVLIFFNIVQVLAAFAGANPHPPEVVVPMIAATAGLGIGAVPLIRHGMTSGCYLAIIFAVVSMIGMGPHKLLLENGFVIAPVALLGFAAELVLIFCCVKLLKLFGRR